MKLVSIPAVAIGIALISALSGCLGGSDEGGDNPSSATTKQTRAESYGKDQFIKDIKAAGWKPDDARYGTTGAGHYQEALRFCNAQKNGSEPGSLAALTELLTHNKSTGAESSSASVSAYLTAVKKTCGLKD